MTNIKNKEILEQAGLIAPNADLTSEQNDAIESLTSEEVEALLSTKNKLGPVFQGDYPFVIFLHGLTS